MLLKNKGTCVWLIILLVAFASCKKEFEGDAKTQAPPETYVVVDRIERTGDLRYTTTIEAHWWGASATGTIKGFEVSTDNMQTWKFTAKQSGTFLLELPFGSDTADVAVYIRSVDNRDQRDPSPASTIYPIRNSRPEVMLDYGFGRTAVTFPAFRLYWNMTDVDGLGDIQGIEIAFNDTNQVYILPGNTTAASFIAEVNAGVISNTFQVYQNTRTTPQPTKLTGIIYDQSNKYYVRAFDRTGARSDWATDSIMIRNPKSTLLLVNDYRNASGLVQGFYATRMTNLGAPYSTYETVLSIKDELPQDNFTCSKALNFFNRIVWYSDDPVSTLGFAQLNTIQFFANGGRMMMAVEFTTDFPGVSTLLDFLPVQSLVVTPGETMRMNINEVATPFHGNGWPVLKSSAILSNIRSFTVPPVSSGVFSYDSLYRANLITQGPSGITPWTGASTVMALRKKSSGQTDIVFSSLPLHRMNANNNIDSLFKQALITELGF